MEEQHDIDDYKNDPCFEPKAKRQKKDEELISNELMLYIINKFGKDFFSENDRKERKLMTMAISEDLMNEKSVAINHEIIYSNIVNKKRVFLMEKKRLSKGTIHHVNSEFYEAFVSLGDCIQLEAKERTSSKKDKKSKKSSKESRKKKHVDVSLNQSVGLEQLFEVNASENVVVKGNIGNTNTSLHENEVVADNQNNLNTINIPGTSSKAGSSKIVSPISYKEEAEYNVIRKRPIYNLSSGYFFDNSIDIRDKMKLFFGPSDSDEKSAPTHESKEEDRKSVTTELGESKDTTVKSQEENVSDITVNVPQTTTDDIAKEQEKSSDNPMIAQDAINSEVNLNAEIQEDSHNESGSNDENATTSMHGNLNTLNIDDLKMVIGIVEKKKEEQEETDETIGENNLINDDNSVACGSEIPMEINDENIGQEIAADDLKSPSDDNNNKMIENVTKYDEKEKPKEDPIKETEKVNETVDMTEQLNQLSDIMENHESLIAKLMSIEDQRVQLQFDILESDMKYKAKLVEIFKKFNKP